MITITAKLIPENPDVLDSLMRRQSSCKRYAFQRLLENKSVKRREFENQLNDIFDLNIRYVRDAITDAKSLIDGQIELKKDPKKVIFGSKKAFKKLQKRHLSKKQLETLKEEYRETRQFNLFSVGEANKKGNNNLRIEGKQLRINIGNRTYTYAEIKSQHKKFPLLLATNCYTVRINKRKGVYHAYFSFEETGFPEPNVNFDHGVIGIDLNAFPSHIAWAEVSRVGNLISCGEINTQMLYDTSSNKRDSYVWKYAKELVALAKKLNKGIVLEYLKWLPHNCRATSNFCYKKLKEAIISTCKREGVMYDFVCPAYTSIIGCVKYAPIYNLSRHTSAALVIARRSLGFEEKVPKELKEKNDKISASLPVSVVGVPQGKKKAISRNSLFRGVYKVCRKAALTEHSTAQKEQKEDVKFKRKRHMPGVNWSNFKPMLFGDISRVPKLAPYLGNGAACKILQV